MEGRGPAVKGPHGYLSALQELSWWGPNKADRETGKLSEWLWGLMLTLWTLNKLTNAPRLSFFV